MRWALLYSAFYREDIVLYVCSDVFGKYFCISCVYKYCCLALVLSVVSYVNMLILNSYISLELKFTVESREYFLSLPFGEIHRYVQYVLCKLHNYSIYLKVQIDITQHVI